MDWTISHTLPPSAGKILIDGKPAEITFGSSKLEKIEFDFGETYMDTICLLLRPSLATIHAVTPDGFKPVLDLFFPKEGCCVVQFRQFAQGQGIGLFPLVGIKGKVQFVIIYE